MADWEEHRDELNDLYIVKNKTLKHIMELMVKKYGFKASKFDYETRFKKWNWQKNMKREDWLYVALKTKKSGRKESAVYFNGARVPPAKVKKEMSRQVHPNTFYSLGALPPSPGYVTVCTPPPESLPSESSLQLPITSGKRKYQNSPCIGLPSSKNRRIEPMEILTHTNTKLMSSNGRPWRNYFFATGKVELKDLPYFQFRDIMNSPGVIEGFERILTSNDGLAQGLIGHFWSQNSSSSPYSLLSPSETSPAFHFDIDDEWYLNTPYSHFPAMPMQLFKPFGTNLLPITTYHDSDTFDILHRASIDLPSVLANIPQVSGNEVERLTELLLGPPNIEAARRFVEFGVYVSSNNLGILGPMDTFFDSMFGVIPWSILRRLLSAQIPTIAAFTENVFRFAVRMQKIDIVQDLIQWQALKALVRSDPDVLIAAVRTSNTQLCSLLLTEGANPNGLGDYCHQPMPEAETVSIAKLLVGAGADVNPKDEFNQNLPSKPLKKIPLLSAVQRRNVELVRYLISVGADVNASRWDRPHDLDYSNNAHSKTTLLMCAVRSGNIDVLQLLLKAGAIVDDVNIGCGTLGSCICNPCGCTGVTALQMSAALGNLEYVRALVQYGADINAPVFGKYGVTALQAAISNRHTETVKYLLKCGADVNAPGSSNNKSLLTAAVEMGNRKLIEIILDSGVDVNTPFGKFGCTALDSAMMQGNSEIYNMLVAKGAKHTEQTGRAYFYARLREAVINGHFNCVKTLVDNNIEIEDVYFGANRYGEKKTLLQYALSKSRDDKKEMFQFLFDSIRKGNGKIIFHPILVEATKLGDLDVLAALLDAGANVNTSHVANESPSGTPLMFAVEGDAIETVLFLLQNGADVNVEKNRFSSLGHEPSTALQMSLNKVQISLNTGPSHCSFDIFYLLLQHNAKINTPIIHAYGLSELAFAVQTGNIDIVQHLLILGAEVNQSLAPCGGRTALQAATDTPFANISIVQLLLKRGADVNGPKSRIRGRTALGGAVKCGHFQIALVLLEAGADVNAEGDEGRTPLMLAARHGRLDTVHLLLRAGADTHLPEEQQFVYAIKIARAFGYVAIVAVLEKWKDDKKSRTYHDTLPTQSKGKGRAIEAESEDEDLEI